jgi:hypothetical protein
MCVRYLVAVLVVACSSGPREPSVDFKSDVAVFCGALEEGELTTFADLPPRILPRIRTDEFKALWNMRRDDPAGALFDRLEHAAKRSGQTSCPTLDWMRTGMTR